MKKIISVIITITMLAALLVPMAINSSAEDFIEVQTWEEFAKLANDNYGEGSYKLMSDSVCETSVESFTGTFDGNGHTITVKNTMFLDIGSGAVVRNFTTTATETINVTPIILGISGSTEDYPVVIENITNNVNVDTLGEDFNRVGGIAGWSDSDNYVTFKNCINNGSINANEQVGGIIGNADLANGYLHAKFIDCANNGDVYTTKNYAAGIVGNVNQHCDFIMVRCVNTGDITAKDCAGGIISRILGGKANVIMYKCASTGNIANVGKVESKMGVAGLVCRTSGTAMVNIYDSFVSGAYAPDCTLDETGAVVATSGADAICQYPSSAVFTLENVKVLFGSSTAGEYAYTASELASGFEYADQVSIDAGVAAILADYGNPYDVPGTEPEDTEPVTTEPATDETTVPVVDETTAKPADDTTAKPADVTTANKPADTTVAASEGGCGGSIAMAIVAVAAVGAVVVVRKKED